MKKICFHLFFGLIAWSSAPAQTLWPAITNTAKPWTRWWWMGSAVNAADLRTNLTKYSEAGLGGVEIVPIYGAKGYENFYISYLSPKWMEMLDTTIGISKKLNMGVDMAVGTGWPIGGPQVTTEDAASKLQIQEYKLSSGQSLAERIRINDPKQLNAKLQALMAYGSNGEILDLMPNLTSNGSLEWTAPQGEWQLYAAFLGKTLQKVKRAAPGGEGFSFDHFSSQALQNYFKKYDTAYRGKIPAVRSYFNDSYELFGANWSPSFFEEFRKRRGYDLKKYLREFNSNDSTDLVSGIKSDYRQTMADLMLENFSNKFTAWAHSKNALSTNQAHGSPGNLLDLYAAVDIAETETFGSSYFPILGLRRDSADVQDVDPDPVMMKFPSSAANAIGHKLVSCETFTWLTEHFKTSWAQCKPEVEKIFLSGINHVFFHGTTYSPADAPWPGWLFYASVNFVPNNSMWPHLPALTNYITRCQSILQQGKPDNDVLLYWPVYDAWQNSKGKDMPFRIHNIDDWLQPTSFYKAVHKLQQEGYSVDFVSDKMIQQSEYKNEQITITDSGGTYKTIVIPATRFMPVETFKKLITLAQKGAKIFFESLPEDVPGLHEHQERKEELLSLLSGYSSDEVKNTYKIFSIGTGEIIVSRIFYRMLVRKAILPDLLTGTGLQYIRRKNGDDDWYYVVNHTAGEIDTLTWLQSQKENVYFLDPQTGRTGIAYKGEHNKIRIQLKPGESIFIKCTSVPAQNIAGWQYNNVHSFILTLTNKWKVVFTAGGPELPAAKTITQLSSWTEWNDTTLNNFSGTAVYSSSFDLKTKEQKKYILDLGKVCESAKVWINGKAAGIAWSLPYELEIGNLLKKGRNEIKIEVANLMANRIRYMDKNRIPWRNYHEINFVNSRYKNFDASGWPLQPSGLIGPVLIRY